ncbi:MAG: hypothetical protein ACI8R0_002937, partial [Alteromonadales bacterium]
MSIFFKIDVQTKKQSTHYRACVVVKKSKGQILDERL